MKNYFKYIPIVSLLATTGCATMANSGVQVVKIRTETQIPKEVQVTCTLRNNKGQWETPIDRLVQITRDENPLEVTCSGDNLYGKVTADYKFDGIAFGGNTLIDLCIISCTIDAITDAWYMYDTEIFLTLEEK